MISCIIFFEVHRLSKPCLPMNCGSCLQIGLHCIVCALVVKIRALAYVMSILQPGIAISSYLQSVTYLIEYLFLRLYRKD